MAEKSKQGSKEKGGSTSAKRGREASDQLQDAATTMATAGVLNAAEGAEKLQAASDMSTASREMLAEGASDTTRGMDAEHAAQLADRLGEAVATVGARYVTGGRSAGRIRRPGGAERDRECNERC